MVKFNLSHFNFILYITHYHILFHMRVFYISIYLRFLSEPLKKMSAAVYFTIDKYFVTVVNTFKRIRMGIIIKKRVVIDLIRPLFRP